MLSTPATRLEWLYLLLSLPTPLLSLTTSSQRQVGGAPPQHTHMCVATCKPRISFQRKFTISVKLFFSSFFPINIRTISLPWPGSSSGSPRVNLNLPLRVQGSKHTIQRIFSFFSHSFRQQEDFLFHPPRIQLSQFTLNTSLTVQLQQCFLCTHEPTALQHSSWFS